MVGKTAQRFDENAASGSSGALFCMVGDWKEDKRRNSEDRGENPCPIGPHNEERSRKSMERVDRIIRHLETSCPRRFTKEHVAEAAEAASFAEETPLKTDYAMKLLTAGGLVSPPHHGWLFYRDSETYEPEPYPKHWRQIETYPAREAMRYALWIHAREDGMSAKDGEELLGCTPKHAQRLLMAMVKQGIMRYESDTWWTLVDPDDKAYALAARDRRLWTMHVPGPETVKS